MNLWERKDVATVWTNHYYFVVFQVLFNTLKTRKLKFDVIFNNLSTLELRFFHNRIEKNV